MNWWWLLPLGVAVDMVIASSFGRAARRGDQHPDVDERVALADRERRRQVHVERTKASEWEARCAAAEARAARAEAERDTAQRALRYGVDVVVSGDRAVTVDPEEAA